MGRQFSILIKILLFAAGLLSLSSCDMLLDSGQDKDEVALAYLVYTESSFEQLRIMTLPSGKLFINEQDSLQHYGQVGQLALSRDGKSLLFTGNWNSNPSGSPLFVWRRHQDKADSLSFISSNYIYNLHWQKSASRLQFRSRLPATDNYRIYEMHVPDGQPKPLSPTGEDVLSPGWIDDGRTIIYFDRNDDNALKALSTEGWNSHTLYDGLAGYRSVGGLAASSDGSLISMVVLKDYTKYPYELWLYGEQEGVAKLQLRAFGGITNVAIVGNPAQLIFLGRIEEDYNQRLYGLAVGDSIVHPLVANLSIQDCRWSDKLQKLVLLAYAGYALDLYLMNSDGSDLERLSQLTAPGESLVNWTLNR